MENRAVGSSVHQAEPVNLRLQRQTEASDAACVNIDAASETSLRRIAVRLRAAANAPDDAPLYTEAGALRLNGTFGDGQLRHGSVIGVGIPVEAPPPLHGPLLAVIGGPDAGAYILLRRGTTAIGRDQGCQLPLRDPDVSRRHAIVTHDAEGIWLVDAGSANGTALTGCEDGDTRLDERPVQLTEHTPIRCGSTVLWLTTGAAEPLPTRPTANGMLELLRPPRLTSPQPEVIVDFPAKPHHADPPNTPWLGVALSVTLPLVLGTLLWWFMRESMGVAGMGMLAFMALSPVLMLTQVLTDRWNRRRTKRTVLAEHTAAVHAATEKLAQASREEIRRRRAAFPDPFTVAAVAAGPTTRLWERRPADADWLRLRVGLGTLPAEFVVRGRQSDSVPGQQPTHPELRLVPAMVDLAQIGVLGVAGTGRRQLCQWLISQLAVLHSPRHLRLALLTDTDRDEWTDARWLPHLHGEHVPDNYGITADPTRRAALVNTLLTTVKRRAAERVAATSSASEPDQPAIVLIHDSSQRLSSIPGGGALLDEGPAQRVFAICLAEDARTLPEQCGATAALPTALQLRANTPQRVAITSRFSGPVGGVVPDLVGSWWFTRLARSLAPLVEHNATAGRKRLPRVASFAAVFGTTLGGGDDTDEQLAERIVARWQEQPATTHAVIGADSSGPIGIDLAVDGPHALIAGTTGAGKSELLRTWLASLALGNRPDELNLMLIDYKGGSAFAECAALPHVVGLVTDLDTALTTRVLSSLRAELQRRERRLAETGATDFEQYRRERHTEPLARLMVVIDEFATLCAELPNLVTGLVDLARRGRSLGVHLVLATQRPAGVVSAEIRANTALRICLRVTDPQDSSDVLDSPDAASIGAGYPGRALLRQQGTLIPVQIARVSEPSLGTDVKSQNHPDVEVRQAPWQHPPSDAFGPRPPGPRAGSGRLPTTLTRLVTAVQRAARSDRLRVTPPIPPWLPPLPSKLTLHAVEGSTGDGGAVGLHDLPHEQAQRPYLINLADAGHLALAGGPHSGRTGALRAIAAGLALEYSPEQLRMFVFDNDGEVMGLSVLPHCDAVVAAGDAEHCQRLLHRLRDELHRRRASRRSGDTAGEAAQPWLVLLLDSWETLRHNFDDVRHGTLVAELITLLRDGGGTGLRAFVTGDRQLLTSQLASLFSRRLILRMADNDGYGLAGIATLDVPKQLPPGRALVPGNPVTALQFALLDSDVTPHAQREALGELAQALAEQVPDCSVGALPVDALPSLVTPPLPVTAEQPWLLPLGVGGDRLRTAALDLRHCTAAMIAGPPGSGKTTALRAVGQAAVGLQIPVIEAMAGDGMGCGLTGVRIARGAEQLRKLLAELDRPGLILLNEVETLVDTDPELDQAVHELIDAGEHRVVLAGGTDELLSLYRGCTIAGRRTRTGLLLSARPSDGELFGQPGLTVGGVLSGAGRGLLVQRGSTTTLQVVQHD